MYIYTNLRYAVYSRPTSQTSAGAETFLRKVCEKWGGWVEVGKREGCREEGKSGKLGGGGEEVGIWRGKAIQLSRWFPKRDRFKENKIYK